MKNLQIQEMQHLVRLRQKNPEDTKKIPLKFIAYTFGYEKGLKLIINMIF